ncbi:MAG: type II CAAX endopeptidase family protein [Verrucomicrobia bacterium]|nr:type II CAAX endopeptidase family protein [Verrucomicrobiota bacterium]
MRALALVSGAILLSWSLGTLVALAAFKLHWIAKSDLLMAEAVVMGFTFDAAGLIFIGIYLRKRGVALADAFGLKRGPLGPSMGRAVMLCLLVIPVVYAAMFIWQAVLLAFGITPEEQDILKMIRGAKNPLLRGYLLALAVGLAPVFEETFFRGFMYPALKQRLGIVGGLAVVSLVFASVHLNLNAFVPVFVLGAMLGLAYELTGTILVPITIHALFNTANLILLLFLPEP